MNKQIIYDYPTRIFHWLFAALFVVAFMIAKSIDDDNPVFTYHMLAGLLLSGLVTLRIIWGFIGTRYARFTSFVLRPSELLEYLKGVLTGDKKRWTGHNPASSWATLVMLVSALLLGATGFLMTTGSKETFEDIHEIFANIFLVTVLLHIAGVLLHALRLKDGIFFTMFNGKKEKIDNMQTITSQKPIAALSLMIIMGIFTGYLIKNYNETNGELNLFGKVLTLGENEEENDVKDNAGAEKEDDDHNENEESEDDDD